MFRSNKNRKAGKLPAYTPPPQSPASPKAYDQRLVPSSAFDTTSPSEQATHPSDAAQEAKTSPISPMPPTLPPIQRVSSIRSVHAGFDGHGGPSNEHRRMGSADSWFPPSLGVHPAADGKEEAADMKINFSRPRRDTGGSSMSSASRFHFRNESEDGWAQHPVDLRPITEETKEPSLGSRAEASTPNYQGFRHGSPTHSRPATTESSKRSYIASDSSSFRGGATLAPPIVMVGPLQESTSPSIFPVGSHRPPPRPPTQLSYMTVPVLDPAPKPRSKLNIFNRFKRRGTSGSDGLTYPGLPEDYDPSIRGNRIHDFSEPRPPPSRQAYSSPMYGTDPSVGIAEEYKPYTPVFKEHFDDAPFSNEDGIRAEGLANQAFIARNAGPLPPPPPGRSAPPPPPPIPAPPPPPSHAPPPLPTLQISPLRAREGSPSSSSPLVPQPLTDEIDTASPLSPVAEDPSDFDYTVKRQSALQRRESTGRKRSNRRVSGTSRSSRLSSSSLGSVNLPTHMNSRASRFSFQLVSKDSAAQERMLEERHKEREAAKKLAQKDQPFGDYDDDDDDDYDFDEMDDYEEDIPTIGEEWDSGPGLSNMTLDGGVSADANNFTFGAAPVDLSGISANASLQGLGILSNGEAEAMPYTGAWQPIPTEVSEVAFGGDDDLYFDDGLIDEVNFDDTEKFDEAAFDDPGHHLYERKPVGPQHSTESRDLDANGNASANVYDFTANPSSSPETLVQYHNILALAATKAAEAGRFAEEDDSAQPLSAEPSLVADDSRTSKATTLSPPPAPASEVTNGSPVDARDTIFHLPHDYDEHPFTSDMSDYDSAYEEDSIIAAANADALANDEDGFYGSEFGFWAKPGPDSDGEETVAYNGGFFGPKSWGEIKRQRSTREPNLTPITEKSEYSARNSFASFHNLPDKVFPGAYGFQGAGSPGIAQLARMSNGSWDADKNLETLMKLRRGAFGGSQGSLRSVNSGGQAHPSSPLASNSNASFAPIPGSGFSPRPNSSSRVREAETAEQYTHAPPEALVGLAGPVDESQEETEEEYWKDDAENDSVYSDTSDIVEDESDDFHGGSQMELPSFHRNNPFFNVAPVSDTSSQTTLQPLKIAIQEPTPRINAPDSPPPSNTSATSTAFENKPFTEYKDPNKPLPSYTTHRPTPLDTSLQPPPLPKGASGTFYSPASTITTELSSPTKSVISPTRGNKGKKSSHSRQGSDTVAYTQERDEETGEFRWILERRRTGDDGVESLVRRSLIEPGTI